MSKIKRPTTAALAAQPGGLPSAKTMAPKNKFTISKLGGSLGLSCFGAKGSENTWKFNGNKKKIEQNWRKYDLPPAKLAAASEKNFETMQARAEQRNATRIPDRARAIVAATTPILEEVAALQARLEGLAERLNTAEPDSLLHATFASLTRQLADKQSVHRSAIATHQVAQDDIAADSIDTVRAVADLALADSEESPGDASRAAYASARTALINASVRKFFDGYRALNDHVSDQGRAKGMAMMLPVLARQLELPAKYREGVAALEIAETRLAQHVPPGIAREEGAAALRDALVGRRVRDLTAGRTNDLPGKPPSQEETKHWQAEAARLRGLGEHYGITDQLLGDTMPKLKERVDIMQQTCMDDLVAHLPSLAAMDGAQRAETTELLGVLAERLRTNAGDTLHKDQPLAPMQLVHIVEMAETVTEGDPARCLAVYRALVSEQVQEIIDANVAQLDAPAPAGAPGPRQAGGAVDRARTEQDLVAIWRMGAHQLPDAVSSLMAANPAHNEGPRKVDWRDVQTFFRCSQEHERLATDPAGDARHKARMASAMNSLRDELATGARPATGSPERRDWAMAKSAVWEHKTMAHVVETFEGFKTMAALPSTVVKQVHQQFDAKGRGEVAAEAQAQFKALLTDFKGLAQATLARPDASLAQQGNAKVLLALCDYVGDHRGSERFLTKAKRKLTRKDGTFNSGRHIWTNPLKGKEKHAILEAAGASMMVGRAAVPLMRKLDEGHSALDLLKEAVSNLDTGAAREARQQRLSSLENLAELANGGHLAGPEPIRRFLHDSIDRTSLGDRTDTLDARQFKWAIPIILPLPLATLSASFGGSNSTGTIVNVSANNDCVQMTLGRMSEKAFNTSLGAGLAPGIMTDAAEDALDQTCLDLKFPSYSWKREERVRSDPAIVLKFSIEPNKGLRDLDEARTQLKKAVDILVDWDPHKPENQQYGSVYEALCDKLDSPFTIDEEVRDYETTSNENILTPGRVALQFHEAKMGAKSKAKNDPLRTGVGATFRYSVSEDKMESNNQQKARELFRTLKKTVGLDVFFGLNTRHTTAEDKKGNKLVGVPVAAGGTGSLLINVGGGEFKDKKPVGTDKLKAYKTEFGDYSRDMKRAIAVLLEALPSVSNRVQEVIEKGFRDELTAQLAGPAQDKLNRWQQELGALQAEIDALRGRIAAAPDGAPRGEIEEAPLPPEALQAMHSELARKRELHATLTEQLTASPVELVQKRMVEKELGKMGGEVLMNFVRALTEQKTDRFSVKLESKQQWAHRGIEAAIANAEAAGDKGMATLMKAVDADMFVGHRDQAVKYLIAAGDLSSKTSQFNWRSPLKFKRRETKGMSEDPIPDTRSSTLEPTAERLVDVRQGGMPLSALETRIVKDSLGEVRANARARQQDAAAQLAAARAADAKAG